MRPTGRSVSEDHAYVDSARPKFPSGAFYRGEKIDVGLAHVKARAVRGRLEDEDGRPLAGARVRLVAAASRVGDRPLPYVNEGWEDAGLEAATGADGRFRLGMLPEKSLVTVEVRAAGFACTRLAALTTPPLGTLAGSDAGSGTPARVRSGSCGWRGRLHSRCR